VLSDRDYRELLGLPLDMASADIPKHLLNTINKSILKLSVVPEVEVQGTVEMQDLQLVVLPLVLKQVTS